MTPGGCNVHLLLTILPDAQHDGALPTPSTDRKPLSERINSLRDPANLDTENFDEAVSALGQNVWRPISSGHKVPADVETLFSDPACENVTAKVRGGGVNASAHINPRL